MDYAVRFVIQPLAVFDDEVIRVNIFSLHETKIPDDIAIDAAHKAVPRMNVAGNDFPRRITVSPLRCVPGFPHDDARLADDFQYRVDVC